MRILDDDELGAGNTVQVVAYKAGSVFAGGVLLLVRDAFGWSAMFNVFAAIYVVAVLLLSKVSIVERADGDKKTDSKDVGYCTFLWSNTSFPISFHTSFNRQVRRRYPQSGVLCARHLGRRRLRAGVQAVRAGGADVLPLPGGQGGPEGDDGAVVDRREDVLAARLDLRRLRALQEGGEGPRGQVLLAEDDHHCRAGISFFTQMSSSNGHIRVECSC